MGTRTHVLIDEEDVTIFPDVESPALGIPPLVLHEPIFHRDLTSGIAQNRVIETQLLSELRIGLLVITAGGEVAGARPSSPHRCTSMVAVALA